MRVINKLIISVVKAINTLSLFPYQKISYTCSNIICVICSGGHHQSNGENEDIIAERGLYMQVSVV